MDNDNEYLKRQLCKIYGISDYEADIMAKDIIEKNEKNRIHKQEYRKQHKLCPQCGSDDYITTLVSYVGNDLNNCICNKCGDKHVFHDRMPKK